MVLALFLIQKLNGAGKWFNPHFKPATSGVIQRGVVCILMFLCLNDVLNVVQNGVRFLFASDMKSFALFKLRL